MYIKSRINRVRTPIKRGITQSVLSSVSLSLSVCVNKDVKTSSFFGRQTFTRSERVLRMERISSQKRFRAGRFFLSPIKFYKP